MTCDRKYIVHTCYMYVIIHVLIHVHTEVVYMFSTSYTHILHTCLHVLHNVCLRTCIHLESTHLDYCNMNGQHMLYIIHKVRYIRIAGYSQQACLIAHLPHGNIETSLA